MTRSILIKTAPAVAIATLAFAWAGLAQDPGIGQKAGEKFDAAVQDIKGGLNKAGEAVKDRYAKAKQSARSLNVEARIYSRLHWDKALNEGSVELSSDQPGVFTLTGQVADLAAKKRAVDLAETTEGVTRVVDQLSILPVVGTETTTTKTKSVKPNRP